MIIFPMKSCRVYLSHFHTQHLIHSHLLGIRTDMGTNKPLVDKYGAIYIYSYYIYIVTIFIYIADKYAYIHIYIIPMGQQPESSLTLGHMIS